MQFLVDTQLPPALAHWLSARGHPAIHTTDKPDGHLMTDKEILTVAHTEHRHGVTKDHDFLDHFLVKGVPPRVLLLEYGNASHRDLLQLIETQWPQIDSAFQNGAGFVLAGRVSVVAWS
jgi:predicted nuclease of predicted toxin-antitoxin system